MVLISKVLPAVFMTMMAASGTSFEPGGLEYQKETFNLVVDNGNGEAELSATYSDFGSKEEKSIDRKRDMDYLKNAVVTRVFLKEAADHGVEILDRRLDFENFTLGIFVKAKAKQISRLFEVFALYQIEFDDMLYIIPLSGTVTQATLSPGGKIVVRNEQYAFAWPLDTQIISFTAVYKRTGVSFRSELSKQGN